MSTPDATVRRAGPEDAEALAELRAVMLDALGEGPPTAGDDRWRSATVAWFGERLVDRDHFAAFLADDPEFGVVACAVGAIAGGAPLPGDRRPVRGQVFSVATDPRARRRGHARACTVAVLEWLDAREPAVIDLSASPEGIDLYRSLGFVPRPWTAMRRRG